MSQENSQILQKKDFLEIEFTGNIKDGEIFDSNIKEDFEKINSGSQENSFKAKPFIFSLGENMFLKGVDDFLIGKSFDSKKSNYNLELNPEKAFGLRDSKLIQIMPMKVFREQNLNPVQGLMFNFDGRIAKILTVSGGRVIVDFNNPLAGKIVQYKINVLRKVEDINEKTKAIIEFLFRKELKFEVNEKDKKIIIDSPKEMKQFIELFKDKFKDILGFNLEVKELMKANDSKEKVSEEKK